MESTVSYTKDLWESLADSWDKRMGDRDNRFHREIIRPATMKLLEPTSGEYILDIACGNGNFSKMMAEYGAKVVAFDYSEKMIQYAKSRCKKLLSNIEFKVIDATNYDKLISLKTTKPFDKAVSNMAIMDITDIQPLFKAVYNLLAPGGIFVFSGVHPCFQTPHMRKIVETNDYTGEKSVQMGIQTYQYITPCTHRVTALATSDQQILHFHRSLSLILNMCFEAGFVLDGMEEPVFEKDENKVQFDWYEIPPAIILRLKKSGD